MNSEANNVVGTDSTEGTATPWLNKISEEQEYWSDWFEQSKSYMAEYSKSDTSRSGRATGQRKYSMLWANVEVLKTATYAKQPVPQVSRRFKDQDPVGRVASEVLERCLSTTQDMNGDDDIYKMVRDDFLVVGRGSARVRYEAIINGTEVDNENVPIDHYHYTDFLHGRARKWVDVPWVAFGSWLTKDQWNRRFNSRETAPNDVLDGQEGEDKFPFLPYGAKKGDASNQTNEVIAKVNEGKARVWEIWDKTSKMVYWVAEGHPDILDQIEPPISFRKFYPCPRPAFGTITTESLQPEPDYTFYRDQAEIVSELTKRISKLTAAVKLVGFYPGGDDNTGEIERALSPSVQDKMIPIHSWSAFTDKGGAGGVIQWLPIDIVAKVIGELINIRRTVIDDIYQIAGISDILRGASKASETATAQQIKAEWGGVRISDKQGELHRFTRDMIELKAEVIAEVFGTRTLQEMSGLSLPTDEDKLRYQQQLEASQMAQQQGFPTQPPEEPEWLNDPTWDAIIELLRNERMRGFRIDVETDSTIMADEVMEKAARNEFLAAVGAYIQQAMPVVQQAPMIADAVGEMLLFTVRGYRAGRELEETVEEAVAKLKEFAMQQLQSLQNPQPDPMVEATTKEAQAKVITAEANAKKASEEVKIAEADRMLRMGELRLQSKQEENRSREAIIKSGEAMLDERSAKLSEAIEMLTERLDALSVFVAEHHGNDASPSMVPSISDALSA